MREAWKEMRLPISVKGVLIRRAPRRWGAPDEPPGSPGKGEGWIAADEEDKAGRICAALHHVWSPPFSARASAH